MNRSLPLSDREAAGRLLAAALTDFDHQPDVIVLALPRGGVPVAAEIARALQVRLDLMLVRKLGVPGYEELAMGAIASGGVRVMNEEVVRQINIPPSAVEAAVRREGQELQRREKAYRDNRPALDVKGRTVLLVDDGLATGATMRAAVTALRRQHPRRIVIAVPTAAPDTCEEFRAEVDDIVCAITPTAFYAVGAWYEQFPQNTDEEVQQLLGAAHRVLKKTGDPS